MLRYKTEISREFTFEAAHRLPNVPESHKCSRLHGHSYRVEICVGGPIDQRLGWIVDYADLKKAFKPLHDILDHHYLNEIEGLENPTSEMIALWIIQRLKVPGAKVTQICVKETCTSACTVYAEET